MGTLKSKKWRALGAQAKDEKIKVRVTTEKRNAFFWAFFNLNAEQGRNINLLP